jgi:drug/metabolite transporter (DMT)-like permease
MKLADLIRLLVLSVIWGGSFLFMRLAAPEFGPLALICVRVGGAALLLGPLILLDGCGKVFRERFWDFLVLGVAASSLPFCLLAYSTLSLEAGFTSLLNATTPIFTAIVGVIWFRSRFTGRQYVGLAIGLVGVGVLSWNRLSFKDGGDGWAIVAALVASTAYGVGGNFTRQRMQDLPPRVVAAGSTVAGTLLMLPFGIWKWPEVNPSFRAWGCALALAVVCTAVAYLLFFKIISSASAMATSTVTFLIPVSAILWGYLMLQEKLTLQMVAGMVITFLGTALVIELFGRSEKKQPAAGDD